MTIMTRFCMNTNYRRYQDETSNWTAIELLIKNLGLKNKQDRYFIRKYEVTFYTVL